MSNDPEIVFPHGGYRKLIAYRKSDVIYQGTVLFCRRFLVACGDRTVDQMTQAARSCKQNIAEGSASSGTSKESEIRLTNVAKATLDELMEDYLDYLKINQLTVWPLDDEKSKRAREFARAHSQWDDWRSLFETRPAETVANLMLTLCHQERFLLDRMIFRLEADFKQFGDVRERMRAARNAVRVQDFDRDLYAFLVEAKTSEELQVKANALLKDIPKKVFSIKQRKGWT